jgi:hypothetical protein
MSPASAILFRQEISGAVSGDASRVRVLLGFLHLGHHALPAKVGQPPLHQMDEIGLFFGGETIDSLQDLVKCEFPNHLKSSNSMALDRTLVSCSDDAAIQER